MASQGKLSHRPREQRNLDLDFLIRTMYDRPDLSPKVYHQLLLEEIKTRGQDYTVTHAQTCRDIVAIRQNAIANAGVNLKSKMLDSLAQLEYLMSVTMDQLEIAINEDRKREEVKVEDLQIRDIDNLTQDEKALFYKLRSKVKKTTMNILTIPAGSDIKDLVLTAAKLNIQIRTLLGLDAPKKIDTRNAHVIQFDQMTSQDIVDKCKTLGITTKDKLMSMIEEIEFSEVKKKKA